MQNIERYFGYKVVLTDELDPVRVAILQEKADYIKEMQSYSDDEFVVYFHQLSLMPNDEHFSSSFQLEEKIKRLDLSFSVNPKQVRNGKIKLYNYLLKSDEPSNYKEIAHAHQISYMIQGSALKNRYGFRNEIVTFVNKKLRKDHRKLKVSVQCRPTEHFKEYLTNKKDMHLTQIDFKLDSREVSLLKGTNGNKKEPKEKGVKNVTNNTYINNGVAGAMGETASSTNSTLNQQVNSGANLGEIVSALEKLKKAMKATIDDSDEEQEKSLSVITLAHNEAKQGNEKEALGFLKKGGKWAFEVSEKIGTQVLSAYIKTELGL